MTLIYALSSAFFHSLAVIFESLLVNRKYPRHVTAIERLVPSCYVNALILCVILILNIHTAWIEISPVTFILLLSIGIIDAWYNILNLKALEIASPSKVVAVASVSPIITLIISTLFLGSNASLLLIGVVFLIAIGIYIMNLNAQDKFWWKHLTDPFHRKFLKYAFLSTLLAAISIIITAFTLQSHYVSEFPLLLIRMLIIAVYTHLKFKPAFFPKQYKKRAWLLILLSSEVIYVLARVLQTFALGSGNLILTSALYSSVPFFVLILATLFLKEKLTRFKVMGTLFVIAGIGCSFFLKF